MSAGGESAYPRTVWDADEDGVFPRDQSAGASLQDWFAKGAVSWREAVSSYVATHGTHPTAEQAAELQAFLCYAVADAMLAEREKDSADEGDET